MPQGNVRHFGIAINRVETGADIVRLGLQYVGEHFVYGRLVFHLREAGYVEALREGMKFDFRVPDQAFARSTKKGLFFIKEEDSATDIIKHL